MPGSTAWIMATGPKYIVSISDRSWPSWSSSTAPTDARPALFTSTSTAPK